MAREMDRIELLAITESDNLNDLTDLIHDEWFSLGEVVFFEAASTLEIPFNREFFEDRHTVEKGIVKTIEAPVYRCFLIIGDVKSYSIQDTEKVETYDFTYLEVDSSGKKIRIVTGIPLGFNIVINRVNIKVCRAEFPTAFQSRKVLFE